MTWEPRTQCLPCGKSRTPVWKQYNLLNSIIRVSILYIFFLGNAILQVEYQCSTLLLVNKHPANADHSKTSSHYIMDWQAKLSTCKHVLSLPVLRGRSSPRAKMVHLKKKIVHQAPCKGILVGDVWASGYFGPLGFFLCFVHPPWDPCLTLATTSQGTGSLMLLVRQSVDGGCTFFFFVESLPLLPPGFHPGLRHTVMGQTF